MYDKNFFDSEAASINVSHNSVGSLEERRKILTLQAKKKEKLTLKFILWALS